MSRSSTSGLARSTASTTSTAGLIGQEFCAADAASKVALEGPMESLRFDVEPYGIKTMAVEPGFFRTELLGGLAQMSLLWKPIGMTTASVPADGDPRRLLSDVRALAHRVRLDQRMTWAALLVLAAVTLVGIPFDWFGMKVTCHPDGSCEFARRGMLYYWPAAMLLAYAAIAVCCVRAARERGLGTRVLPYAITGAATTVVFPAAWFAVHSYLLSHPVPEGPLPYSWLVLDRLVMPWGMIGIALLVLAWLERNVALLLFTLGYLALVLLALPLNVGIGPPAWGLRAQFAVPQLIVGMVLLLGAVGFRARRPNR